jgi:hypothetical protein
MDARAAEFLQSWPRQTHVFSAALTDGSLRSAIKLARWCSEDAAINGISAGELEEASRLVSGAGLITYLWRVQTAS